MKRLYLLSAVLFVITGCASGVQNSADQSQSTLSAAVEEFDPTVLPDKFIIPEYELTAGSKMSAGELSQEGAGADTTAVDSSATVPGFRIQIFSTTSYVRANEAYLNALAIIYEQPVYLTYDAPYYKIRVGNFIFRESADSFLSEKLESTFPDAWLVRTFVNPYETSPVILMNDSLLFQDSTKTVIDTTGFYR